MAGTSQILADVYYDIKNPASFSSKKQFIQALKGKVSKEDVSKWLASEPSYTLFFPRREKWKRLPILVDHIDEQWQADLLDMSWISSYNNSVKFLLVVIDCFSKFAWVVPIKDKSALQTTSAFSSILKHGRSPQKLQTDQGKEFVNAPFKSMLEKNGIHFFTSTSPDIKCAIVERFNRTLRSRMYRYLYHNNTLKYIDILDDVVKNYNNSYHRIIRMTPAQVTKANETLVKLNITKSQKQTPEHKKPLKVGQFVRTRRAKGTFEKGATRNWTSEVLKIAKVKKTPLKYIYKLVDLKGEPITSIFYPEEVQPVSLKRVSKIDELVSARVRKGEQEYRVRFMDEPKLLWIPESWILSSLT